MLAKIIFLFNSAGYFSGLSIYARFIFCGQIGTISDTLIGWIKSKINKIC